MRKYLLIFGLLVSVGLMAMGGQASLVYATVPGAAPALKQESAGPSPSVSLPGEAPGRPRDAETGPPRVSIDVHEASIKGVFRLLSEMSGINIASGDDVKGNVTIYLRNVPWDQALATILEINGLGQRRVGNVITVMTLERMKREETERAALREAERRADLERRRVELEKEREQLAIEKERQQLMEERERRKLALERERQELAARRVEQERLAAEKPVEPGTDIFVDMDIRRVFNLLAEEMRKKGEAVSIVAGNDVKGTVSANFRDVSWEQKLDTLLEIKGLAKRRSGSVITVMTMERMKREDTERVAALQARLKAEQDQREREKKMLAEQRKIEQEHREREQRILAEQMKIEQAKRKEEQELTRPPLLTRVVSISYANVKGLQENLQELLSKGEKDGVARGSVRVDEHSNSLILQADKDGLSKAMSLIAKVDKPTPQVLIKANIIETTRETARELGVQWGGIWETQVGGESLFITPGGSRGIATPTRGNILSGGYTPRAGVAGIGGHGFGVNFPAGMTAATGAGSIGLLFGNLGGNLLEMQLNALQRDGKLKILSSPQITTLDNQMAFTENGEQVPYVSLDRDGRPEVKFHDAVLRLEITPNTIDDKTLKMRIIVKKDEVDTTRNVQGNPFIVKKHTSTNLIVQDGETIVISGLTRQRQTEGTAGIPWMQNIPGLGWLFKAEKTGNIMEEVLIFITPRILQQDVVAGIQEGPEASPDIRPVSITGK